MPSGDKIPVAALATGTPDGTKFLRDDGTLAAVQAASTTVSGIVELATSAETITGTDAARAITPAGLAGAKNAASGYAGLSATYQIQFKNTAGTFTSLLTNANTAARTYTFPDTTGTVVLGGGTCSGASSGTNTGDEPAASTTIIGVVELATSAETITGTDTARAVTPAGVAAALAAFSPAPGYTSANTSFPAYDTNLTFTHGLGAVPSRYTLSLVCITTEAGYPVGAEIDISGNMDGDGSRAYTSYATSTQIVYRSAVNTCIVKSFAGAGVVTLSVVNWRLKARAWA
jgi:hypothetical protein